MFVCLQEDAKQWVMSQGAVVTVVLIGDKCYRKCMAVDLNNDYNQPLWLLSIVLVSFRQGCRKRFRAGGGESRERDIQGGRGKSRKKGILLWFFFCVNISTIKISEIWCNLAPLGKDWQGQSPTLAPLSCTLGLIYQFSLRKSQHC